jgi:hypothetical protein
MERQVGSELIKIEEIIEIAALASREILDVYSTDIEVSRPFLDFFTTSFCS